MLLSTDYTSLEHRGPVVVYTRKPVPYPSARSIVSDFEEVLSVLEGMETSRKGLVVDLRGVRGRNDPEFEVTLAEYRKPFMRRFKLVGVVVETVVGRMQLSRYAAEDGVEARVFGSVDEAEAWLGESL